jgi:ABC-type lipoprotein release transport system permease subunit
MWARREITARWRALVVLGVLAGLAGGITLAAVAGARRTASAYARYRQATAASDAIVFTTQVGVLDPDFAPVRRLPEVVESGQFGLAPIGVKEWNIGTLAPVDDHLYRTINRPLLRAGRLPDPRRADEIVVNQAAARRFGVRLGQRVTIVSSTDLNDWLSPAPTGGPTVAATVVGIGDGPMDLIFGAGQPGFVLSGGFLATYPQVPHPPNLVVRLRPGTDVRKFRLEAASLLHLPDLPVRDQAEDAKRITHGTDIERTALLLFAAAVILAALVLVGQALTRTVYAAADAAPTLQALGLTRPDVTVWLTLPVLVSAAVGALVAVATAVALSPRFPIGLAGYLEPDRGVHADWLVLVPGAALLVLLAVVGAALAALRATSRRPRTVTRPGSALIRAIRAYAPLPVAIGAGLALERGSGDRSLPVRPALAGAIAGILGIVGAFGLVRGIDDALAAPQRSGQVWQAQVYPDEHHSPASLADRLRREESIGAISTVHRVDVDIDGQGLPVYTLDPVQGELSFVVLRGRAPTAPGEAVLGPSSAKALHRGIGDDIRAGAHGHTMRVVGIGLLPETPHSSFDQGVWMTGDGLDRATGGKAQTAWEASLFVTFHAGVDRNAEIDRLQRQLGVGAEPAGLPKDVTYLHNVRTLPLALAGFLTLLGLAAVAHVLVTAVRRRRHDLAVLRAMGFRPRQAAACIAWQATTVAVVAIVLGVPLGIAAGRWSWRWVAEATPLLYVAPVATLAIAVAIPGALLLANVVAAMPARRAARLRPAETLRTE